MKEFVQRHQQLIMITAGVIIVLVAATFVGAFLGTF